MIGGTSPLMNSRAFSKPPAGINHTLTALPRRTDGRSIAVTLPVFGLGGFLDFPFIAMPIAANHRNKLRHVTYRFNLRPARIPLDSRQWS